MIAAPADSSVPCSTERAPWRAAACTISCPSTAASSASLFSSVSRPRLIASLPPGRAQALGTESLMTTNSKGRFGRSLTLTSLPPTSAT
jgi:hypothetical protein